ncbi:MAG: LysM peptidoglycan-binding domain-containing protein [Ardenticatenaceae bacterium]|nr:LysM peptidoglycan-binding domain-containing protein [Ardenticatenaceae bacterium]MCB8990843.1 LysM peptidoglycan-binding domain-containing protein [Ardenticatenaceae bacterium]
MSLLFLLWLTAPALAQEPPQPTATPDAEGVIYDVVQPNDSLWAIAGRHGLSFDELLALNEGLTENTVIQPGQLIVVGHGAPPVTPTSPPLPTATLPPPTPRMTATPPRTAVCLLAFADGNRNGLWDAGELLRPAVAFTVYNETAVVANYVTDGMSEPHCIEGLRAGAYHITRSISPQEVLTTDGDWAIRVTQGSVAQLAFGSYVPAPGDEAGTAVPGQAATSPASSAITTEQTPQPTTSLWNTGSLFFAAALTVMILLVGVIFLLIWRKMQ